MHLFPHDEAPQPALDQHDRLPGSHFPHEPLDELRRHFVCDRRDQRNVRAREPPEGLGRDRLRPGLEHEHTDAGALLVPIDGRRWGRLVNELADGGQPGQPGARRRLVPGHGQQGDRAAIRGRRQPGVEDRAAGRLGAVDEVVDGQAAHDEELAHRSIIGACNSSTTSFTVGLPTS